MSHRASWAKVKVKVKGQVVGCQLGVKTATDSVHRSPVERRGISKPRRNVPHLSQHRIPALFGLFQHRDRLVLAPVGHRGGISYGRIDRLLSLVNSLLSSVFG
jgi:hypothetical protein